jgi:hypothetical protein
VAEALSEQLIPNNRSAGNKRMKLNYRRRLSAKREAAIPDQD